MVRLPTVSAIPLAHSVSLDMFLAVIVSATEVGNTRPSSPTAETVVQIHDVGFYCLTSSAWDDLSQTGDSSFSAPGYGDQTDMYMREHTSSGTATPAPEHPCAPLRKIISAGTFYYAQEPQWDISSRLQRRLARNEPWDAAIYDDRFVWNEFVVKSLLDFRERLDAFERVELDQCQFIVRSSHRIRLSMLIESTGACYPRICWRMYACFTRTSYQWHPHCRHHVTDLSPWLETVWDAIQYSRR